MQVKALLARNAPVDIRTTAEPGWQGNLPCNAGFSPLYLAINFGVTGETLTVLLDAGASHELRTGFKTVSHSALASFRTLSVSFWIPSHG